MDFRKALKLVKILSKINLILLFWVFVFLNFNTISLVFFIASIITLILSVVVSYFFIRCPKCGGGLYVRYFTVLNFCPHCGHELDPIS